MHEPWIAPRLGPSLIEQAPRLASTDRLSGIKRLPLLCTGPGWRRVRRQPGCWSDCHAAAVEAREGEPVEGFAGGSALVPQHADCHLLAQRHRGGSVGPPVDARPIPAETEIHCQLVQPPANRE